MATIRKRTSAKGVTSYYAEVRIHDQGVVVARKSATFPTQREAKAWAARTEAWLQNNPATPLPTVGELIARYVERMDTIKPLRRTRRECLRRIQSLPFASTPVGDVTPAALVEFCEFRRAEGAGPATMLVDIGALTAVWRDGGRLLDLQITDQVFRDARPLLQRLGLIGKPVARKRRPTGVELDRILAAMRKRERHHSALLPIVDLVQFLVYSCMRVGEVCSIRWDDVDEVARTVVIRERKHPTDKQANDQVVPLLGPAWEILQRQPRLATRVFPFDSESVSAAFQKVRDQLGIQDLRLHDLRREGISRLLELGFAPHEVMAVSGHRSPDVFAAHYVQISPAHLHRRFDHVHEPDESDPGR